MNEFEEFFDSLPEGNFARGAVFAEYCVEILKSRPEFEVDEIWLWDDWPHRWGADNGIDFVFTDKSKRLWAGQAKCHSEDRKVNKEEVNSFAAESSTVIPTLSKNFDRRILITSGEGLGRNSERLFSRETHAPLTLVTRQDLVEWGARTAHKSKSELKTPLDHQKLAISSVVQKFRHHDKGQLLMACGTGKTLTALWIYEKIKPEVCVVAVPSLSLMRQTLEVWNEQRLEKFQIISLCSDATVAPEDDSITDNILEMPFPVTTNKDELKSLISSEGKKVIFTTYASFPVLGEVLRSLGIAPDLTIADEAHRTTGDKRGRDKTIHDSKLYKSKKTLFMTATPRVFLDTKDDFGDVVALSMDDESFFGPVFFEISFFDAIQKWKLLVDFEVHCLVVEDDHLFESLGIGRQVESDGTLQSVFDSSISQVFTEFSRENNLKRVITYHSRKSRAQSFQAEINSKHNLQAQAYFVSGEMNARQRSKILENLENGSDSTIVVTNARCLTEGIDIPKLDGLAFIDPRYSTTDIVQAIGRVIRRAPGKQVGKILVPLVTNSRGEVNNESFRGIWRVIKALESHDERLVDEIARLSFESGKSGGQRFLPKQLKFFGLEQFADSIVDKIKSEISRETGDTFNFNLGILVDFYERFGRKPNRDEVYKDLYVERWQSKQRANYNAGILSAARIGAIEQSFPPGVWSWNAQLDYDLEMADHLEEFVQEKRNEKYAPFIRVHRVKGKSVCSHGHDVGAWWFSKGRVHAGNGLDPILQERLEKIEGLTLENPNVLNFEFNAVQLEKYLESHGQVPSEDYILLIEGYPAQAGLRLGQWLGNLRGMRRKGTLTEENLRRIEQIPGFTWEVARGNWRGTQSQSDEEWFFNLKKVVDYQARNSKLPPYSSVNKESGKSKSIPEGVWLSRQKRNFLKLEIQRQNALKQLPGFKAPEEGIK